MGFLPVLLSQISTILQLEGYGSYWVLVFVLQLIGIYRLWYKFEKVKDL